MQWNIFAAALQKCFGEESSIVIFNDELQKEEKECAWNNCIIW